MRLSRHAAALACAASVLSAVPAFADLPGPRPGPRPDCLTIAAGTGCDACVHDFGDPDAGTFDACTAAALAKGFVSACIERRFKVETTYFCPVSPVQPTGVGPTTGARGCGGCALVPEPAFAALPALAMLALATLRRRSRSETSSPPPTPRASGPHRG